MSPSKPRFPRVRPLPCPEPECGGKLTLGETPEVWRDRQRAAGRTPPIYAYFCSNRRLGCPALHMANDDGSPKGVPVTKEVRDLRNDSHEAFDRIWRSAGSVPKFQQQFSHGKRTGGSERQRRAITTKLRRICYFFMAHHLDLPEPDVHLAIMSDPVTLRLFIALARRTTARQVIEWWENRGEALYHLDMQAIVRAARDSRKSKEASR